MGNSLQDQLLNAGLVSKHRANETRSDKRKAGKKAGKHGPAINDETRRAAEAARAQKARKDRELNQQRQEAAAQRARQNEIRQLIHSHRVVREPGDVAYNFTDGSAVKRLHMNKTLHAQIVDGRLAIVRQDTFYELVPAQIAERLLARDESLVLVWNQPVQAPDPDDPYADFQVPDDLMW